jgi:Uma2 family endonuclease
MDNTDLTALLERADEAGVRLEIVGGLPLWEAAPSRRHQQAVDRIRASIEPSAKAETDCAGLHLADVYIRFPDGSLKRPDVSIFCREPDELDEAITLVPEAVIEIVSPAYAAKDLEIGPRFYLLQGVKDVIVFDPHTLLVLHMRKKGVTRQVSPVDIALECGCRCVV